MITFSQESGTSGYFVLHKCLIMCEPKIQNLRLPPALIFHGCGQCVPKDRDATRRYTSFHNFAHIVLVTDAAIYNSNRTSIQVTLFMLCL